MELTTGSNVLHISARAGGAFSEEIWLMKKVKGAQLEQTKTLDRDSPLQTQTTSVIFSEITY